MFDWFDASVTPSERASLRAEVRVLVLSGLGLNCEVETETAFQLVGATTVRRHLLDLLEAPVGHRLDGVDVLAFVGGFSFGDHLGAGTVFANKIRSHLRGELVDFVARGGAALGICNGFQTMARLGLVPGFDGVYDVPRVVLAENLRPGYRDAWVRLGFDPRSPCEWTRGLDAMELPSRHGEGRLLAAPELQPRIEAEHLAAAHYLGPDDQPTEVWPHNPSGSPGGVAGLCDPRGRLFGLMPHPDAFLYGFHHPDWMRRRLAGVAIDGPGDGLAIFGNGVDAAAARKAGARPVPTSAA
jgi:phosphoribosylformylglycinamidine (FGAM) synthase-like amidotransferase family enzyme